MAKIGITAYPYATVYGTLEVPDDIPEEELEDYVESNWDDIDFGEPDLDYAGTDFEID